MGAAADIAAFRLEVVDVQLEDILGQMRRVRERLRPVAVSAMGHIFNGQKGCWAGVGGWPGPG